MNLSIVCSHVPGMNYFGGVSSTRGGGCRFFVGGCAFAASFSIIFYGSCSFDPVSSCRFLVLSMLGARFLSVRCVSWARVV